MKFASFPFVEIISVVLMELMKLKKIIFKTQAYIAQVRDSRTQDSDTKMVLSGGELPRVVAPTSKNRRGCATCNS